MFFCGGEQAHKINSAINKCSGVGGPAVYLIAISFLPRVMDHTGHFHKYVDAAAE